MARKAQAVPALFCLLSLPRACTRPPTSGSKQELVQWGLEVLLPDGPAVSLRAPTGHQNFPNAPNACSLDVAWCHWEEALGAPALSTPLLHWLSELLVADTALGLLAP